VFCPSEEINAFHYDSNFSLPLNTVQNPISQTLLPWGVFAAWPLELSEPALNYKPTVLSNFHGQHVLYFITASSMPSCSFPLPGGDPLCTGEPSSGSGV